MACHLLGTLKGRGGVRVLINSPYLLEYGHVYGNWWLALVVIVGWSLDVKHIYLLIDVLFTILWNTFSQLEHISFGCRSYSPALVRSPWRPLGCFDLLVQSGQQAVCWGELCMLLAPILYTLSSMLWSWAFPLCLNIGFHCESEPFIQISFLKNLTGW